ncbi:hypothetical protein NLI96_g5908 [Meripilus lineatus]|uniref:MFS general substrate transporter n=1 Tax=Meripilus lineatus TaxID=2056292 RepID=A0AAD5YIM5_9APHY|nr:hypothetical protein NLI96_g5908 [Physisporinus lineatus]
MLPDDPITNKAIKNPGRIEACDYRPKSLVVLVNDLHAATRLELCYLLSNSDLHAGVFTNDKLTACSPAMDPSDVALLRKCMACRTGERFFHMSGWLWCTIVGYIIGVSTMSIGGRYVAIFLMALGFVGLSLSLVWVSNAIPRPPVKRSASIAIVNGFGNLGTLMGSYVWKAEWGPDYRPSMYIGLASLVFSIVMAFAVRQTIIRENAQLSTKDSDPLDLQRAKRERIEIAARLEGVTFEEALEKNRTFKYLY